MAELADAIDLGSIVNDVGVRVSLPAPTKRKRTCAEKGAGSFFAVKTLFVSPFGLWLPKCFLPFFVNCS